MSEPKPYNMLKQKDRERWFQEMKGYLKTDRFVTRGTDGEGRMYAKEALLDFEKLCIAMRGWMPALFERDDDVANYRLGLQITCSSSPFYDGIRYAVIDVLSRQVLNLEGVWEDDLLPSQRDKAFYNRCRFSSFQEAVMAANKAEEIMLELGGKR